MPIAHPKIKKRRSKRTKKALKTGKKRRSKRTKKETLKTHKKRVKNWQSGADGGLAHGESESLPDVVGFCVVEDEDGFAFDFAAVDDGAVAVADAVVECVAVVFEDVVEFAVEGECVCLREEAF